MNQAKELEHKYDVPPGLALPDLIAAGVGCPHATDRAGDGTASRWRGIEAELVEGGPDRLADIDAVMLVPGARKVSVPQGDPSHAPGLTTGIVAPHRTRPDRFDQ